MVLPISNQRVQPYQVGPGQLAVATAATLSIITTEKEGSARFSKSLICLLTV